MRNATLAVLSLLLLLSLPALAFAAGTALVSVTPNVPAILTAGGEEALVIIYNVNETSADAAFISLVTATRDGDELPNGDMVAVEFDDAGLRQIRAGNEPSRAGWIDLPIAGMGEEYNQRIYSSIEGYEATFTPSIPVSAGGRRVIIEYANDYWFVGEMSRQNRSVMLYKEGSVGTIDATRNLTFGSFGLEFIGLTDGNALVRFRSGDEPTFFSVQDFNDPAQRKLVLWVDYNSSIGPITGADCYLEGNLRGSLSFVNGRYKGQLDYTHLPVRTYSYAVSCAKEGFEPKTLAMVLDAGAKPSASSAGSPDLTIGGNAAPQPTQIGAPAKPYAPPQREKSLFELLDDFLKNPFGMFG